MRIKTFIRHPMCLTAILLILMVGSVTPGLCAEPKKIAVIPFTMNSPQDLSYLQNGLFSMLFSRLSDPGKVQVLDRDIIDRAIKTLRSEGKITEPLNASQALIIGGSLKADYILFGSLTQSGQGASLDASLVDRGGEKPNLTFFEQTQNMGEVITLVHRFAEEVNQKVFNRRIEKERYAAEPQAQDPDSEEISRPKGNKFDTHLEVPGVITALCAGDLKKDGRMKMVAANDYELKFYRLEGQKLIQEELLKFSSALRIVGLDIADINGNGYPEIFVTCLTIQREGVSSFVLEFDGAKYVTLTDSESYYFRVINKPGQPPVLLGQKSVADPFKGDIYTMKAENKGYRPDQKLILPRNVSVMSLAQGAVTAADRVESVLINGNGSLVVASDTGKAQWDGEQRYGGTEHYFLLPRTSPDLVDQDRAYLQSRIQFQDITGKGKTEVLTVKNSELGGGSFGKLKRLTEGNLEALSWNGIGLSSVWKTRPVQGWISDFVVADMDKSGVSRIWVSVVKKSKLLSSGSDKSNIISYQYKQ